MQYKLANGKEQQVPAQFVRISHLLATIGGNRMELVDNNKDHFYIYEVDANRFTVIHFSGVQSADGCDMCLRTVQAREFHVRYHPSDTERLLDEQFGE